MKIARNVVLVALPVLITAAYAVTVMFPLLEGPALSVQTLAAASDGIFTLDGYTKRVVRLTVNDFEVPVTEEGHFELERAYPVGYTVLVLRAYDRFGRMREEVHPLTINEPTYGAPKETSNDGRDQSTEESELNRN